MAVKKKSGKKMVYQLKVSLRGIDRLYGDGFKSDEIKLSLLLFERKSIRPACEAAIMNSRSVVAQFFEKKDNVSYPRESKY